jgi:regulator of chromosome condensation
VTLTPRRWGCGEQGQLGQRLLPGRERAHLAPTRPLPITTKRKQLQVVGAFAGSYHSFAKTSDGQVWAFGLNNFGQLGFGDTKDRVLPASVPALRGAGVEAIDGGEHHSIALTAEGGVMAWGRADSGQLGLDRGDDGAR